MRETKRAYGWPEDAQFLVPDGVKEHFADGVGKRGAELRAAWEAQLAALRRASNAGPRRRDRGDAEARAARRAGTPAIPTFERRREGDRDPQGLEQGRRTRSRERLPWLLAGSADLTDSTSVRLDFDGAADFEPGTYDGRQLHYGIREHESAAISNGLSLSKLRPLWSTYLTFSDYARPAIRLSALMELPVDPPLHPRLDRARRGRPDPPAGRAARLACGRSPAST